MVQYQADCGLATTWYAILAHLPPSSFLRVCVSVYKYSMSLVSRAVWHVRDGSAPFRMYLSICKIVIYRYICYISLGLAHPVTPWSVVAM